MPQARWGHVLTSVGDKLILHGGQRDFLEGEDPDTTELGALDDLYVYDFLKMEWTKPHNSENKSRCWHSAVFYEKSGNLLVFGGEST